MSRRKSNREEVHERQSWDCHIPRSANLREARMSRDVGSLRHVLALIDSIDTQTVSVQRLNFDQFLFNSKLVSENSNQFK